MQKGLIKLSFRFLVLGILVGSFWFFYNNYGFSQTSRLQVVVAQQPGSPLLIAPTFVDPSDPLKPRYGYLLTNISNKPIRAYTIQFSTSAGTEAPTVSGTEFINLPAVKLFMKPNETKQEEGGRSRSYSSSPTKIELSVDFVEFADGTRWGKDTGKSGETLDGIRAGGKAAIKKYREILATEGIDGLERAMGNSDLVKPENQSMSGKWRDGFTMGVNFVKGRVSTAKTRGGQDEARRELEKPFDSTEGRQEP